MTQLAWPVDGLSADGQIIRQSMGALIGAAGGTVGPTGLAVTQKSTPAMFVVIQGGTAEEGGLFIPGFSASTGPYYFQNTANVELAIPTSDATNPRIERIVARVYDNAVDGLGKNEAGFESLKGTAETGATLGNLKGAAALPKNCYTVAYVLVPAKATAILTADILDQGSKFTVAPMLALTKSSGVVEAHTGELLLMEGGGTVTLPAAAVNTVVGVFSKGGSTTVKQHGADKIYGDFISAASTITLLENQHVILQSDGTNWFILAGESKREQTVTETGALTQGEAEAGIVPSTTRLAFVSVNISGKNGERLEANLESGGHLVAAQSVGAISAFKPELTLVTFVMPGQSWKLAAGSANIGVVVARTVLF